MQLVSLDADGYDISNLAGLQYATNLQFLDLANNSLTSLLLPSASGALIPLGQVLMQLKYVDLDNNQLADLTALQVTGGSGPTQLQAVSADYNAISDLSPLNGMTSLAYLSANNLPEAINGLPGPSLQGQYGSGWNQLLASLPSPSGQSNDNFGYCTASVGAYLLVGDPMYTFAGGTQQGAVLVYDKSTGAFLQTLLDPQYSGSQFGSAMAVAGDFLIIGADGNSGGGNVYIYNAASLSLLATVADPLDTNGDEFGFSLASVGSRLLVGAPHSTSSTLAAAGIVYEYSIPAVLAAATPSQLLTITDKHGQANGLFGDALTAVGGQIAIGAPGDNVNSTTGGWAELFDPVTGLWVRDFANPGSTSGFGSSLATSGTTVIIGAPKETDGNIANSGAVYLYNSQTGSELERIANPNPSMYGDQFGISVAGVGSDVLVGAPFSQNEGSAYLFGPSGNLLQTFSDPNQTTGDEFGYSVAAMGNRFVVGSPGAATGSHVRSVQIYDGVGVSSLTSLGSLPQLQTLSLGYNQLSATTALRNSRTSRMCTWMTIASPMRAV